MTPDPAPASPSPSGVVAYTILCLTALMGMVLVLMEGERDPIWVLFLAGVGAVGVMARWRAAPPLLLLGLTILELYHRATQPYYFHTVVWQDTMFTDVGLCAAVLAYSAGQYRLLTLTHSVFPVEARGRHARSDKRSAPADARQRRSPHLPRSWEIIVLVVAAVGWAVGVSLYWLVLSVIPAPLELPRGVWRGLLLIFTVGLTTAVLGAAAAYLNWLTTSPAEHLLFLQDVAWRETRREQNQINRWLTWARLRRQRRKEKR
jgi:hypothetical protein